MTNPESPGMSISEAVKYTRELMETVSLLLQTADKLMGSRNWEPQYGNYCVPSLSYSLLNPKNWIPRNVFRYYKHPEKQVLVIVDIVFDDPYDKFPGFTERW